MSTIITIKSGEFAGDYRTNFKNFNQRILSYKDDGTVDTFESIKNADFAPILAAYQAEQAQVESDTPEDTSNTPDAPEETTEKKEKKHPTADAFLAKIPADTYIFRTNKKGHILISKVEGDKTAYARIRPLKDGAYIFPGKELKATRSDWEFHAGWANEYALKVKDWDEVAQVLNLTEA